MEIILPSLGVFEDVNLDKASALVLSPLDVHTTWTFGNERHQVLHIGKVLEHLTLLCFVFPVDFGLPPA